MRLICATPLVGVAIAARTGETREVVRYVKGDPLIVSVPTLRDEVSPTPSVQPRSLEELLSDYAEPSDSLPTENSPPIASFPTQPCSLYPRDGSHNRFSRSQKTRR
ncbi:hypothetical protein [Rubritalea tangerina]|uniref:hypothetical protein n=1 Tax=Rubritalea tangerina TaxID=430798 RepID=UPI003607B4C3